MRRKFLASTALTTSTAIMGGAAWAADLPVKAPPVRAPAAYSWNGCYGGVNAGGGWVSIDQSVTTAAPFLPIRTFEFKRARDELHWRWATRLQLAVRSKLGRRP